MASETLPYTPAQFKLASTIVGHFIEGREDQLAHAKKIVVEKAVAIKKAGDPTVEVFRVAHVDYGTLERVDYALMHDVNKGKDGIEGKFAVLEIGQEQKTDEGMNHEFGYFFGGYESPLIQLVGNLDFTVGQIAEQSNENFTSYTHITRIY